MFSTATGPTCHGARRSAGVSLASIAAVCVDMLHAVHTEAVCRSTGLEGGDGCKTRWRPGLMYSAPQRGWIHAILRSGDAEVVSCLRVELTRDMPVCHFGGLHEREFFERPWIRARIGAIRSAVRGSMAGRHGCVRMCMDGVLGLSIFVGTPSAMRSDRVREEALFQRRTFTIELHQVRELLCAHHPRILQTLGEGLQAQGCQTECQQNLKLSAVSSGRAGSDFHKVCASERVPALRLPSWWSKLEVGKSRPAGGVREEGEKEEEETGVCEERPSIGISLCVTPIVQARGDMPETRATPPMITAGIAFKRVRCAVRIPNAKRSRQENGKRGQTWFAGPCRGDGDQLWTA